MRRVAFLLCVFFMVASAEEILFVEWGNLAKNVKWRKAPEGRYGPQSFYVRGDSVWILDSQSNLLKLYVRGSFVRFSRVPEFADEFLLLSPRSFVVLSDNKLYWYENERLVDVISPPRMLPLIKGLNKGKGVVNVTFSDGRSATVYGNRRTFSAYSEETFYNGFSYRLLKEGEHAFSLDLRTGGREGKLNFSVDTLKLGSVTVAGLDSAFVVVDADFIAKEVPLEVSRRVLVFSARGRQLLSWFEIPVHYYTYIYKDLYYERGFIYHMVSSSDGVHVFKWDVKALVKGGRVLYPGEIRKPLHYNFIEREEYEVGDIFGTSQMLPYVTRKTALDISRTYVEHRWTCASDNITNGPIQDPDGHWVETPEWVVPGSLVKIPYQWGGFYTPEQFDSGIKNKMYAGDKDTRDVSRYARGVDCSGFVSRCWTLPSHYSTKIMPQITKEYSSWSELKPADAIHRVGHVRLCVNNNPDGTILAIEASGRDWRVNYHSYRYSDLENYAPRYYVNIIGSSIPLAQPALLFVADGDSIRVRWSLDSRENVDGFVIEHSVDGVEFSPFFPDSIVPESLTSVKVSFDPMKPCFVKVYSANAESSDEIILSLQSDVYGVYRYGEGSKDKILIVDGFDRFSGTGSWPLPYHPFAMWMGKTLAWLGIPFETVANEMIESGAVSLGDYKAVFWILGDESTQDETFSVQEQNRVMEYLKKGGQLFVSGSEVGWDLDNKGDASDKGFFHNFLKASYIADDAGIYSVTGLEGTIFEGLVFTYDDGRHGIYEEDYPDVIKPVNGSIACLKYGSSDKVCGIQYEGLFPGGEREGKLVYFGIPWETIVGEVNRRLVLQRIALYFGFPCTGVEPVKSVQPRELFLSDGYPNPFNSMIRFELYTTYEFDPVAYVYDILGRRVKTLTPVRKSAGSYEIIWNGFTESGKPAGSGEYLLVVDAGRKRITRKLLFLK